MRSKILKIAGTLFLAVSLALPGMALASGLESLRSDLAGLYLEEQSLRQTSLDLRNQARLISERIAAQKPDSGEPNLTQRNQLEGIFRESKQLEAELARVETRNESLRDKINQAQENLLAELSRRIAALEKQSRKKPDQKNLSDLLGLRREKEALLDHIFTNLNPRIVLPAASPEDSPQEIQNKLEVLDLAQSHLRKQLEVTGLRLEELKQQMALSRGLREFLEDTYDFSAEVSRRDEILAKAQAPPEAAPVPNPTKESPGGEGIAIIDFDDTGNGSSPSSASLPEVRAIESSGSNLALPAGASLILTLDEKIHRWQSRKAVLEELIQRVNARIAELKRER